MALPAALLVVLVPAMLSGCGGESEEAAAQLDWQLKGIPEELSKLGYDVDLRGIRVVYEPAHTMHREVLPPEYDGWSADSKQGWTHFAKHILNEVDSDRVGLFRLGYYAPWRKAIVIASVGSGVLLHGSALLAHEAVHVYQHQHREMFTPTWYRAQRTWEEGTVLMCLGEGEAERTTFEFLLARNGRALSDVAPEATLRGSNQGVQGGGDRLLYDVGLHFFLTLGCASGPDALGSHFASPPSSSEQLRHPVKLGKDLPTTVVWPDIAPSDATLILEDTCGALRIEQWLTGWLGRSEAFLAAAGWDGDALRVYRLADGTRISLWVTLWDRPEDAKAFGRAVSRCSPCVGLGRGRTVVCGGADDKKQAKVWVDRLLTRLEDPPEVPSDAASTHEIEQQWKRSFRAPRITAGRWLLPMLSLSVPVPRGWTQGTTNGLYILKRPRDDEVQETIEVFALPPHVSLDLEAVETEMRTLEEGVQPNRVIKLERVEIGAKRALLAEHAIAYGKRWVPLRLLSLYVPHDGQMLVVRATVYNEHHAESWSSVQQALRGVRLID